MTEELDTTNNDAPGNGDTLLGGTESDLPEESGSEEPLTKDDKSSEEGGGAAGGSTKDDKSSEEGSGGRADGESDAPPEYAEFNLPEGFDLDAERLAEITPIFKELGLTQEQAQTLVDNHASQMQAFAQEQVESFNQLRQDWRDQVQADKSIGGDNFDSTIKDARVALDKFGTPELKQVLNDTGVGDHPEVIRMMARIGSLTREDVPGSPGGQAGEKKDRVSILYPDSEV